MNNAIQSSITPGLIYHDASHTYVFNGRKIPHLTGILADAGYVEGVEFMKEEHRVRGSRVHVGIHFLNDGDLNEEHFNESFPGLMGYLDAVRKFWKETGIVRIASECPMAHTLLEFGCTIDLLGMLEREVIVVEYKTGAYQACQALQVAAQVETVRNNADNIGLKSDEIPKRGIIVQLSSDGEYRIHDPRFEKPRLTQPEAFRYLQGALIAHQFKARFHKGEKS